MPSRYLKFSIAALVILISACGSSTVEPADESGLPAALEQALANGSATFVLARAEQQSNDLIVTFDHVCQNTRIMMALRDSILIMRDGQMRRSSIVVRSTNGVADVSGSTTTGTWRVNPVLRSTGIAGVSLLLKPVLADGRSMPEIEVWLQDANTILIKSSMGGSCPGSPNDGRSADFFFTRR